MKFFGFIMVVIAILIGYRYNNTSNTNMDYKRNEYILLKDFVSDSDERNLMKMYENVGIFESAKADFSSKVFVEIGEGYKPTSNGSCIKHGSLLHKPSNSCLFLPRLDAVRHYMRYGGYEGWKERIPKLTSRISSFIRHEFNAYNRTEFKSLFESKLFTDSVNKICPKQYPYFKPIELNLNIVGPGQGFLAHHDAVYFLDATRHQFPLWLLNVMKQSNLFNDKLLPQVQGIVYIGPNNENGGQLYFYPNGVDKDVMLIPPISKSAILMDGTEIVHGTTVYQNQIKPLPLWQNTWSYLKFDNKDNVWRIYIDNQATNHTFKWNQVRGSIAYRALCFKEKQQMIQWNEYDIQSNLTIDIILDKLKNDLVKRNIISQYKFERMDKYELGLFLMKEYIKLPKPELPYIPFNYCIVLDLLPKWFVDSFLGQIIENMWC